MIRLGQAKDIASINDLGKLVYEDFNKLYNISDYLENDKYIILVNEEEIINGFIIILKNIDCFELEMLVVSVKNRNKGIATNLLNYFINNYTKKDDVILLEVSSKNETAIKLYKQFDFKLINIRKKYYQNADAYIMKKVIN